MWKCINRWVERWHIGTWIKLNFHFWLTIYTSPLSFLNLRMQTQNRKFVQKIRTPSGITKYVPSRLPLAPSHGSVPCCRAQQHDDDDDDGKKAKMQIFLSFSRSMAEIENPFPSPFFCCCHCSDRSKLCMFSIYSDSEARAKRVRKSINRMRAEIPLK